MKKINKSFLMIALLLGVLFGNCKCKKDPDPTPEPKPTVPLEDMTAYSYFKTGTYWVYKDSATGVEDSVYVYSDTSYSYYNSGTPNVIAAGNYMYYDCKTYSFLDSFNYEYEIDMGYYGGNKVPVWRTKFKPGDFVGESFLMFGDFTNGSVLYAYTSPGAIYFIRYYENININSIAFAKVVHFHDTKNASENMHVSPFGSINPSTDFFIAKNIGIVKRKIYDLTFNTINKTDYLVRYHIVQ